ncbi:vesicle coat component [Diplodia intermedia]|uniref:Protein transport protein sec16 n=1 Tax=Diplodia intermedia TaxID=856260 RepID=A0ABR3TTE4_9PEZI
MDDSPAASPPAKAPSDDQSASWNPALRPDSAHAPAPLSTTTHDNPQIDSSAHMADVDPPFDSPPPRTSEDRHPLNDDERPRFVFDEEDDDFDAWQNDDDHLDLGHDDAGSRTPLATERSATPQPPALSASVEAPHDSHEPYDTGSSAAEATSIPPVEQPASASEPTIETLSIEHPASVPDTTNESTPIEQSAPIFEAVTEPAPAEQAVPEAEPTIDPTAAEQPAAETELAPEPAEEAQLTPTIEHEQPDIETIDTEALHETNPSAETPAEHTQEQNYEHQGETTTLEEAVQESAEVPLANDAASPALEWGASDSTFDLGSQQPAAIAEVHESAPEPVSEQIAPAEPEPEQVANVDWGNVEDDAFDLGGQHSAEPTAAPQVEQDSSLSYPDHVESASTAVDLDWGTAGDDDFSLGAQQTTTHDEPPSSSEPQPAPQTEVAPESAHVEQALPEEPNAAATLDWGDAADDNFDLGTAAPVEEAPAVEVKVEAATPAEEPSGGPDLDWGTTADDDFGFSAVTQAQPTESTEPKNEETDKNEEADLSAMWAEALADDDLLEDPSATEPSATEPSVDPSAFFLDDDEGFLDDTPLPAQNGTGAAPTDKYAPAAAQAPPPPAPKNPYAPQGLQTTNVSQPPPAPVQASPYAMLNQPYQQPQRPAMSGSAQSYADKAKGGYASPFDLPDDIVKQPPRKKIVHASVVPGPQSRAPPPRSSSILELVREIPENEQKPATPPPPRSIPGSAIASPARKTTSNYTPQYQQIVSPPAQNRAPPPRRAQSQSPGATMKGPLLSMAQIERPASTNGVTPPSATASPYTPFAAGAPTSQPGAMPQQRRSRALSVALDYVKPTDETANDPLERWKGAPIFNWGVGGTILTSFPKDIPRYGTNSAIPMVKWTAGEVKLHKAKEFCPLWEPAAKFPGPLKTKSQKKQALTWLHQTIETMEKDYQSKLFNGELPAETRIHFEEKILLWKVLEVFVDHDGHLEGSDAVNQAVRKILSNGHEEEPQFSSPVDVMGSGSVSTAEPIDPKSVEQLRAHLFKGDREKAVWEAADKRLWGHAMLIASTLNKDIWKQVAQEFVRQEVRKVAGDNQSLAALYEVFAGNWEESIDELVPASARAGFQMVSKTDRSGANTNVFQGLDRWRETLLLIVNNRSDGDPQALVALGKLLAGYGRVEAAHICYLFARSAVILGGADDLSAHVVLIGADQLNQRSDIGRDIEPILLTEIFEFAVSLSAPTAPPAIPHLQAYKLAHAFALSEYGYKTEAQAYCDAITTAMKSTTRSSPYYNASLVQELDELIKRLSEAPKDSSSWKPTIGKVGSSFLSGFNKFIAGEDDDAESTGPGGADTSPFAKVSGDTPTVSRSPSTVDIYGTYSGGSAPYAPSGSVAGSRYAPASGGYAPRTSGEQPRSRYEPVGQSPYQPQRPSMEAGERPDMPMDALFAHQGTPPSSYNPPTAQYAQQPKVQSPYAPSNGSVPVGSPLNPLGSPYTPTTSGFQSLGATVNDGKPANSYEPPTSNFGPPLNSHEPPSTAASSYEPPTNSYEPPSYQPYEPEPEAAEEKEEEKPKKKSFMDDDGDDELERRAAALKAQQKAEADRIADEAFRKAAEADAAKPAGPKKSGSWLGGWFKRSENGGGGMGDAQGGGNKPIRAKLGEENSFYYDPDLKKWVNKKAGPADHSRPAATPPPPRGGPPLRPSASMANLAGPPAKAAAAGLTPPPPGPPGGPIRSTSMPPPMAAAAAAGNAASAPGSGAATPVRTGSPAVGGAGGPPGAGPPSRPATSMSNASSIDDLLGVPAPRKGPAAKKKGRGAGRYVDVMAK